MPLSHTSFVFAVSRFENSTSLRLPFSSPAFFPVPGSRKIFQVKSPSRCTSEKVLSLLWNQNLRILMHVFHLFGCSFSLQLVTEQALLLSVIRFTVGSFQSSNSLPVHCIRVPFIGCQLQEKGTQVIPYLWMGWYSASTIVARNPSLAKQSDVHESSACVERPSTQIFQVGLKNPNLDPREESLIFETTLRTL